jgi:hypothetical protein
MLTGRPGIEVAVLERFGDLAACLARLAAKGIDTLFVSSGDGTIHAIQTELAERNPFPRRPRLALLAHGTANMTAADLGFGFSSIAQKARLIADPAALARETEVRLRPTLRVANPRDGQVRHGMFVGAGAISQATRFCQETMNSRGLKGNLAPFLTLTAAVARAFFSPADPGNPARIDRPHPMRVSADGMPRGEGDHLAFLATTLRKLLLNTRPFWGGAMGPIRASTFPYPPPSLARWLIPAMYGSEDRTPPPGALSFAARAIDISTASSFVIDGEFFDPPEGEPLRIETGPEFAYLCRR